MSGSIPFYQKHHRHYDRGYRSRETESAISQYQQSSNTYSSHSNEGGLSPLPKRAKPTYLAMDKENQIIGYVVPIFREYHKRLNEDSLMHTPEFVIKPRSHTVWEKQCVRLHCTISGWPEPRVVWYKNNVSIDPMAKPGKYKVESSYSVHALEINKCDFDDTAQYRVSAMNSKGETSAFASVVVKSRIQNKFFLAVPTSFYEFYFYYGVKFETHIVEKFGVSFGLEGETLSFGCSVIIYPSLQRFQPEIEWYRDDKLLVPSKWVQMHWSGDRATLTLSHLNKEDEGLYTLRVITKSGFETHSAYVFVRDGDAEVAGAPGAPLDVHSLDANKDYVIISWKQPAVDGGSPILGYFVDRCEVGMTHWAQCNDTPVKFARFPVTGLVEGRSYVFRVRAVNKAGMSHPSRVSEPVDAMDPADRTRKGTSAPWTGQIIVTEEEPVEGVVPGRPCDLSVIEATKNYVVLSWKPPGDKGHEGVMYYVEKCVSGTDSWQRVNTEIPVKSPRFALFDLAEGKSYRFRVRCCNSAGVGEPSEPTEATTVGDKLDIPSAPGRVVPTRNTDTSVVVSWEASRDVKELVGYYIESSIAGSNTWEPCNNKPLPQPFACLSHFLYGITVLECVRDAMVLAWKQPTFIGGADITGYFVDYREVIGGVPGKWHEANIKSVSERAYRVSELKENMLYQFQVRAANMAGVGIPSLPSETFKCEEWTIAVPGTKLDRTRIYQITFYLGAFANEESIVVNVDDDGVISLNFECSNLTADSKFVWSKNYMEMTEPERMTLETKGNKSKAIFKTPSEEDLGIYSCFVTHTDGASASYTLSEETLKELLKISHDHKFPIIPLKTELAVELLEKGRVRFWLQAEKISANGKVEYVFNDNVVHQGEKYKMNFDKNTGTIEMFMESLGKEDEGTFTFQLQDGKATNQSSLVLIGDVFKQLQKESEFQKKEWIRKQGPHFVEYLGYEVTPECCVRLKCKVANMKKDSVALWYKDGREIKVNEKLDFSEGVLTLEIAQISKKDAGIYEVVLKDDRGKDTSTLNLTDQGTNSSTPLKIQSTEEGIRLYTFVSYYNDELHVAQEALMYWKCLIVMFFTDRARVAGGLPDVVTIQEGKSLNLTCNIWGDPVPEVTWLKNEREMVSNDHYILKFESGKFASFTITSVSTSDSGKYSILVKNKYGTESGDFTVSLNVIENMGDFGVVSYLADTDRNVIVGPTTPEPTCRSTTPSNRSVPTTPSPVTPTLTSTPANTNPQNKTTATPAHQNQTPGTPCPSAPPAQIPENQSPSSPTPQNQTPDTPILSNTSTPTAGEKSMNTSMDDEQIMLKGEKGCKIHINL
uniref:Myomesin-1 n=1 Tax=Sinocyclocheilus rhinocerous TaxID=307959 RepID=A0A673GXH6_9TELE